MKREIYLTLAAGVLFILIIGGIKGCKIWQAISAHSSFAPPPEAITSALAETQTWPDQIIAIGSVLPSQGAILASEVDGKVVQIHVESGQTVNAGTPIITLDTTVEEAQYKVAEATKNLAAQTLARAEKLRSTRVNSQEEYDDALAEFKQADSAAQALKSILAKRVITAPFDGKLGIREVNIGDLVTIGTTLIPIYNLEKLYINFALPQQALPLFKEGNIVELKVDAFADRIFEGKITAINPQVDSVTRNVRIQATVMNPDGSLRPGMFVVATIRLGEDKAKVVIPQTAINYAPYGDSVWIIKELEGPDGKKYKGVESRLIVVDEKRGDLVAIKSGLVAGEEVATSGLFKLRPMAGVLINNELALPASIEPTPEDR